MRVLFTGAHTDDIEIGAGGLLLSLISKKHEILYLTFSLCDDLPRNINIKKDQKRIRKFLNDNNVNVDMLNFKNRYFHQYSDGIRKELEERRESFIPDLIVTHHRDDIHQDHRVIYDETMRVFRNSSIISYENIKSCPNFIPNFYYILSKKEIDKKIKLISFYKSQSNLYYTRPDSIRSLSRFRGTEINTDYAESFFITRIITKDILCAI